VIVGAMAASWVNITTSIQLTSSYDAATGTTTPVMLQEKLDGAFPGILTMLFVLLCWWLMAKKKVSPIKVMIIMIIVAFVGVLIGFFNPGLSY
ncbi:MAG: PTS system mannose/fructose/sorbose family transporter subunit IID, partial [Erysipelotrichia bacterium]|nr:PTS system mannose/fructose/sorbose family transporter subunit IID [Erysipelotrichia bacterium]